MSALGRMTLGLAGVGMRHAVVLAVALVTPGAFALAAIAGARLEGGAPVAVLAVMTVLAAVAGTIIVSFDPSPGGLGLVTRGGVLALVALVIRLLPAPVEAFTAFRAGEQALFSGTFRAAFIMLVTAYVVGHSTGARIALFAAGPPTKQADRVAESNLVMLLVVSTGITIVLLGLAASVTGGLVAAIGIAGPVGAAIVLAHLRMRTPHPSGRRPSIVVVPPGIRPAAIGAAIGVTVVLTLGAMAVMPPAVSETSGRVVTWLSGIDLTFSGPETGALQPEGPPAPPPGDPAGPGDTSDAQPQPERVDVLDRSGRIVAAVAGLLLLVVIVLLRPDRWRQRLQQIRAWFRQRSEHQGVPDGSQVGSSVASEAGVERGAGLSQVFDRLRPRPRDARRAILYDYARVDRALAKVQQERHTWETPLEHAVRVELGDLHERFADLVSTARYRRDEPDPGVAEHSRELQRQITRAISNR